MERLASLAEEVAPPVPLAPAKMAILREGLSGSGYTLASCAARLGVFPRLGVNFWPALRSRWTPDPNDLVDTLLQLFIDGEEVAADRLIQLTSAGFVDAVVESRLVERDGAALRSKTCLFPCYGRFIATDRASRNTAINQVMWLWGESYILGGLVKRTRRKRAIDLGTGSGVHVLLASDHCEGVVGIDVNPRALEFARFNAALNGIANAEFVLSDLFAAVEGGCDLLLANPPYIPDSTASAGDNFWSGGDEGTGILRRIVQALPERLAPAGTAHIIALYPLRPGMSLKAQCDQWLSGALDGGIGAYEVLDHTWPVPNYQDVLSKRPFEGDKSAWRFGVISLRSAKNGAGWWKQVGGSGLFFRKDGSCCVVADHDAP
jgi:methylase of polypeptide subunit release factors